VISEKEQELLYELCSSLKSALYDFPENFHKANTIINRLEDFFDNTKGIRKDIKGILKIDLQNIRNASPKIKDGLVGGKDFDKLIKAYENFSFTLDVNLTFKLPRLVFKVPPPDITDLKSLQ